MLLLLLLLDLTLASYLGWFGFVLGFVVFWFPIFPILSEVFSLFSPEALSSKSFILLFCLCPSSSSYSSYCSCFNSSYYYLPFYCFMFSLPLALCRSFFKQFFLFSISESFFLVLAFYFDVCLFSSGITYCCCFGNKRSYELQHKVSWSFLSLLFSFMLKVCVFCCYWFVVFGESFRVRWGGKMAHLTWP